MMRNQPLATRVSPQRPSRTSQSARTTVLFERPMQTAGLRLQIQVVEVPGEESVLGIAFTRDGQPAGGTFISARNIAPVAAASARAGENPPRIGVVGHCPLRSGAQHEIAVVKSFRDGVCGGAVTITLLMPTGERKRSTSLDGETLAYLDRAIDLVLGSQP